MPAQQGGAKTGEISFLQPCLPPAEKAGGATLHAVAAWKQRRTEQGAGAICRPLRREIGAEMWRSRLGGFVPVASVNSTVYRAPGLTPCRSAYRLQTSKEGPRGALEAKKGGSRADFCCWIADSRIEAHRRGWMIHPRDEAVRGTGALKPLFYFRNSSHAPVLKGRPEQERKRSKP